MKHTEQIINHLDRLVYRHLQQGEPLLHLLKVRHRLHTGERHFQHGEVISEGLDELHRNLTEQQEEIGHLLKVLSKWK